MEYSGFASVTGENSAVSNEAALARDQNVQLHALNVRVGVGPIQGSIRFVGEGYIPLNLEAMSRLAPLNG